MDRAQQREVEASLPDGPIQPGQAVQAGADHQVAQGAEHQVDAEQGQGRGKVPALHGLDLVEEDDQRQDARGQVEQRMQHADAEVGAVGRFLLR